MTLTKDCSIAFEILEGSRMHASCGPLQLFLLVHSTPSEYGNSPKIGVNLALDDFLQGNGTEVYIWQGIYVPRGE